MEGGREKRERRNQIQDRDGGGKERKIKYKTGGERRKEKKELNYRSAGSSLDR